MKSSLIALIYLLILNTSKAQVDEPIKYIRLEFSHSLRIAFNNLEIALMLYYGNKNDNIKVIAKSTPLYDDGSFQKSIIDTSFLIDRTEFQKIIGLIKNISANEIFSQETLGDDGSTCRICFGTHQNYVSYSVWSPDYNTKERRLESFMLAFKTIIELAKIDPENIFD